MKVRSKSSRSIRFLFGVVFKVTSEKIELWPDLVNEKDLTVMSKECIFYGNDEEIKKWKHIVTFR